MEKGKTNEKTLQSTYLVPVTALWLAALHAIGLLFLALTLRRLMISAYAAENWGEVLRRIEWT